MIHYMHIIRHLQGCSSEPYTSVLQCHLGKHIILPLSLGLPPQLGMAMFPTRCRTSARIPWYSIMQIETPSTGVICHFAEAKLDQICLPSIVKSDATRLTWILYQTTSAYINHHVVDACRRCHASLPPKLPYPMLTRSKWRFIAPKA